MVEVIEGYFRDHVKPIRNTLTNLNSVKTMQSRKKNYEFLINYSYIVLKKRIRRRLVTNRICQTFLSLTELAAKISSDLIEC